MHIEHPHERQRLLDLAEQIEGETLARWLAVRANPYSWTDPRHEPAQREIERREMIRARRQRRQANG